MRGSFPFGFAQGQDDGVKQAKARAKAKQAKARAKTKQAKAKTKTKVKGVKARG
jgi:hypothetical protein